MRWYFVLVFSLVFLSGCSRVADDDSEGFHAHADLRVVLYGKFLDFSQEKYMATEEDAINAFIHFHDGNGEVVHMHAPNLKLKSLFDSLNFGFNSSCFVTDSKVSYCNNDEKKLRMFVNGFENLEFENYVFSDLDRILIIYGNYSEEGLNEEINLVSERACIESLSCPEKGNATHIEQGGSCAKGACPVAG